MPVGAIAGSGVLSAGASMFGANSAAKAQTKAAQIAAATQQKMYDQTRTDLAPFRDVGNYAAGQLQNRLTDLTSPIVMDQNALEQTPGYRFNLNAGLKAAQTSAAARGLGLSGAAIKAASTYATGLADNTYQNQFNNENTNRTNAYNRLYQTATLGGNAAAQTGSAGIVTGQGIAQSQIGAGNAQGGAAIAGGNAIGAAGNALAQYYAKNNGFTGNKLTGNPGYYANSADDFSGFRPDQWI